MINKEKIKLRIAKAIKKLPETVTVKRESLDKFNQPTGDSVDVCTIEGLYHKGNTVISVSIGEGGIVKGNKKEYFMVVYDENAKLIQEGDYFELKGHKYVIQDLGNNNDIYLDMLIERM
ncbi:hypothetical protein Y919_02565 [Caloranaerobacter azorensis H53214]|uniref:Uncharacterized protein n=1 Tax=Caloranaerobacter azorensis H53214 TaxID=1156417 RepID=A0A096CWZ4_9FIRM|nr:hypothetical protein [Caloranaerobacter azorensis]KGG81069.1 hypothetical protein Y919_02565 [Caloranaerobacter azorensis H53214]